MSSTLPDLTGQASTGIKGLDFILRGGLPRGKAYLIQGGQGVGKTTLALQFLLAGLAAGERVLFITLSQSERDLHLIARSHGWSLAGLEIHEVSRRSLIERLSTRQTIIHPADVEMGEMIDSIRDLIGERQPDRLVFDSVSAIRTLAVPTDPRRSLGLHSVRNRTTLLGGHFEIESRPGAGTRVTLVLPL